MKGRTNGALLMLDLDKFKLINDSHGHNAGDEVLIDFTDRLRSNLRSDDWLARFGGEEFVVWLPDIKPVDAIHAAERLRKDTENSCVVVNGKNIYYTVSIGLQIVKNSSPTMFENWIKAADEQLYQAKSEGRNKIICGVATTSEKVTT